MDIQSITENLNMELFMKYEPALRKALINDIPRYWHSISVAITAVNLADIYDVDKDETLISAILHDYCKHYSKEEMFAMCDKYGVELSEEDRNATGCIHGFLAAKVCKEEFDINDNIYNAIYFHTCGRPAMTMLEKIIYISDFIEPLRKFRDQISFIRKIAFTDIDASIIPASEMNLEFLHKRNMFIHSNTIKTMEYYKKVLEDRKK